MPFKVREFLAEKDAQPLSMHQFQYRKNDEGQFGFKNELCVKKRQHLINPLMSTAFCSEEYNTT